MRDRGVYRSLPRFFGRDRRSETHRNVASTFQRTKDTCLRATALTKYPRSIIQIIIKHAPFDEHNGF